jgi:phage shock protein E
VIKNVLLCILFSANFLTAEVIIDVRTSKEFQSGHLEQSINIEWQDILSISSNTEKSKKIYLYCRSGNRSQKATEILSQAGFINVENLGSITQASEKLKVKIVKKDIS